MKKIFTLCLSVLALQAATAQNLEIRDAMGTVLNGDTVDHAGLTTDFDIQAHNYYVFNVSSSPMVVKCKRTEINAVPSSASALCWTVCSMDYNAGDMPVLTAPGGPQTINNGFNCDLFVLHYKPLGNPGTSLFRVAFINNADANDSAHFYIRFHATVSVPEVSKNISIKAYPNPANQFVNFEVDQLGEATSVKIVDVLGSTVKNIPLTSLNTKVSTADLKEGVYFYSVMDRNKVLTTRRFVISR